MIKALRRLLTLLLSAVILLLALAALGILSGYVTEPMVYLDMADDWFGGREGGVAPEPVSNAEWDLAPFESRLVRLEGRLIRTATDEAGKYGVLSREGSLVVLRITDAAAADTALAGFTVGDRLRATGWLLRTSEERPAPVGIPYQVHATDTADLSRVWLPWPLIWSASALVMFVFGLGGWMRGRRGASEGEGGLSFQSVFEQAAEPMLLLDERLRILDGNAAACALLGRSYAQLHFSMMPELLTPDEEEALAGWEKRLDRDEGFSFKASLTRDDDQIVNLDVKLSRVEQSSQAQVFAVLHDLTEVMEQSRLFRHFHNRLLENIPIEVVVLSPQGEYIHLRPNALIDAHTCNLMLGQTDVELCQRLGLHPEVALRRRSYRKHAMSRREVVTFEETLTLPSGEERHYFRAYNPVEDKEGGVFAVVGYGMDTTEQKRYQAQAEASRLEAEKTVQLREAFLDNISHELRTPLSGILGAVQVLNSEVAEPEREFVEMIERNGQRLMTTLNTMLDLVGLQAEEIAVRPEVVNVAEIVGEVARSLTAQAEDKGLFLRMQAARSEIMARLDPLHLQSVLENLLGNAIKFTESGGVLLEVDGDAEGVHLRVLDTGVGIQGAFTPQLFEAFHQEQAGTTRPFEGAGIGLTVTKRLIDLMQGQIVVDSQKGEGSMFSISFPTALLPVSYRGDEAPLVLIVDAESDLSRIVPAMLQPHFQTLVVSDLEACVAPLQQEPVQVVLVDLGLVPEVPAATLAEAFRSIPDTQGFFLLAMKSGPGAGTPEHFVEVGFDGFVAKPLGRRALLERLSRLFWTPPRQPRSAPESLQLG